MDNMEPMASSQSQSQLQPHSESFVQAIQLGKWVNTSEGPLTILDDINFSIPTGTSVAVLGASGSGKTTLLGLLAGLDVPTAGQVKINGQDLGAMDEDGRALLAAIYGTSLPDCLLQLVPPGSDLPPEHPAHGKGQIDGRATAYVCRGATCSLPITDPVELARALAA